MAADWHILGLEAGTEEEWYPEPLNNKFEV
jgi:hypothetical protein